VLPSRFRLRWSGLLGWEWFAGQDQPQGQENEGVLIPSRVISPGPLQLRHLLMSRVQVSARLLHREAPWERHSRLTAPARTGSPGDWTIGPELPRYHVSKARDSRALRENPQFVTDRC
jgi:hypothetical protein